MRGFMALVAREIHERKALLAAAVVASALPVLAPVLAGAGSNPPEDVREAAMWVMVLGLAPLFALLLGVGFIGRDLAEGRMGFYYSLPLSGPTIWFGKLTAVVLLIWSVEIIVMLPTVLLAPDPRHFLLVDNVFEPFLPKWIAPLVFWIASAAIVLLAHAVGIVWRARSAWIVLDLVAALVVISVAWLALEPALWFAAPHVCINASIWLASAALFGLLLGGAIQVTTGRIDLRRCHRALSATLWTILGVCAVAVFAWTHWVKSATIHDIRSVNGVSVGAGEWIAVDGFSDWRMDYQPKFLLNVNDGRSLSIGPALNWKWDELEFSADGSRAFWTTFSAMDSWPVMYVDLEEDDPEERFTGVILGADWGDLAVSADGSRVAVLEDNTVAVYQVDPPEQLIAAQIDDRYNPLHLLFDDAKTVRVLASSQPEGPGGDFRWRLFFVDLEARDLVESAEFESPWRWGSRSVDGIRPDRLAWVEIDGKEHLVLLGADGSEVAADFGSKLYWSRVRIMGDGRIVVIRDLDDDHHIDIFDPDGMLIHRIGLPVGDEIRAGGEVAPDEILVGLWSWEGDHPNRKATLATSLVDLRTGQARSVLDGYAPVLGYWWGPDSPGAWGVGSVAGRLVYGEDWSISLWDSETDGLRQLIPVPD